MAQFSLSKKSNLPAKQAFIIRFLPQLCRGKKHFYPRKCLSDGCALRNARRSEAVDLGNAQCLGLFRRKSHFSDFFDGLNWVTYVAQLFYEVFFASSCRFIILSSTAMRIIAATAESRSANGPAHSMPSIPMNTGSIIIGGSKNKI